MAPSDRIDPQAIADLRAYIERVIEALQKGRSGELLWDAVCNQDVTWIPAGALGEFRRFHGRLQAVLPPNRDNSPRSSGSNCCSGR